LGGGRRGSRERVGFWEGGCGRVHEVWTEGEAGEGERKKETREMKGGEKERRGDRRVLDLPSEVPNQGVDPESKKNIIGVRVDGLKVVDKRKSRLTKCRRDRG